MLTASGQERDRQAAKDKGSDGFLTKPTGSFELIKTVTELLS
jgi:CheY-like chemotaxis protein